MPSLWAPGVTVEVVPRTSYKTAARTQYVS